MLDYTNETHSQPWVRFASRPHLHLIISALTAPIFMNSSTIIMAFINNSYLCNSTFVTHRAHVMIGFHLNLVNDPNISNQDTQPMPTITCNLVITPCHHRLYKLVALSSVPTSQIAPNETPPPSAYPSFLSFFIFILPLLLFFLFHSHHHHSKQRLL